jgi:hypothetical protein
MLQIQAKELVEYINRYWVVENIKTDFGVRVILVKSLILALLGDNSTLGDSPSKKYLLGAFQKAYFSCRQSEFYAGPSSSPSHLMTAVLKAFGNLF